MKIMRIATVVFSLIASTVCWAAVPASQVGAYGGTMKQIAYFDGGGKQVSTVQMLVNIAANGTTVFTINGAQWNTAGISTYTGTEAAVVLTDPTQPTQNTFILVVYHFKGTNVKGRIIGLYNVPPPPTPVFVKSIEATFKLKKL